MPIPNQLYNDTNKDMLFARQVDGELFALKYTRRNYYVLNQEGADLNIYSEVKNRLEAFATAVPVPFRLQLNPSEDDLSKYGIAEERDALAVFSRKLMEDEYAIVPKIGDRFDHDYTDEADVSQTEQYEIKDVKLTDMFRDSGEFMRYVCGASKTHKAVTS